MRATPALAAALLASAASFLLHSAPARAGGEHDGPPSAAWRLSPGAMPIGKTKLSGVRLDEHRVMWLAGNADSPADQNRCFIYDLRTGNFRETAPVPADKHLDAQAAIGVLDDGSVVVTGGNFAEGDDNSRLSYRYDPDADAWARTGDLPEVQSWAYVPSVLLRDGRLLLAAGSGADFQTSGGTGSVNAFVFDPHKRTTVAAVDPKTGKVATTPVRGQWDYTRRLKDNSISTLTSPHVFGNVVLLKDGRVLVAGGHKRWPDLAVSDQAVDTDFFAPSTGEWTRGAPFPAVAGEDDRIANSHGGRTNGFCMAVLDNGKVVIAGGNTHIDGADYFQTALGRQSILVMTPARNPMASTYHLSANPIPSSKDAGGLNGDGGRNQLPCYVLSGNRVLITGGQTIMGEDLYDSYFYEQGTDKITRGPDRVHGEPEWLGQDWAAPAGYKPGYQCAKLSTLAVGMRNSQLVLGDDTLVLGAGYDGLSADFVGVRQVEELRGESCGGR